MGKLDKEQEARMAGMSYGVRIAREKGIDEAEKELKLRGALGVGLLIDNTRLDKAFEILATTLYGNIMTTALSALADSEGFGEKRLRRFKEAYDHKSMCLVSLDQYAEHFVTFEDMAIDLKKRYNIDMNAEMIALNQKVIDKGRRVLPNVIKLLEHENQHEAADVLREHLHEAVAVWQIRKNLKATSVRSQARESMR